MSREVASSPRVTHRASTTSSVAVSNLAFPISFRYIRTGSELPPVDRSRSTRKSGTANEPDCGWCPRPPGEPGLPRCRPRRGRRSRVRRGRRARGRRPGHRRSIGDLVAGLLLELAGTGVKLLVELGLAAEVRVITPLDPLGLDPSDGGGDESRRQLDRLHDADEIVWREVAALPAQEKKGDEVHRQRTCRRKRCRAPLTHQVASVCCSASIAGHQPAYQSCLGFQGGRPPIGIIRPQRFEGELQP